MARSGRKIAMSPDAVVSPPQAIPEAARAAGADLAGDLLGLGRLTIDAVTGIANIVEGMHRNIARLPPILGAEPAGRAPGLTGFVYGCVRGVTRGVGVGLDLVLPRIAPLLGEIGHSPRREALVAALNGVYGDHLAQRSNPLAIPMSLRLHGRPLDLQRAALSRRISAPTGKLLVLAHGLCANDLWWQQGGHDHGEALARDLGLTPLYLHYNTGQHISTNGRELARLLQGLLAQWPVPVTELTILAHSMGGLVARSATHYAQRDGLSWPAKLSRLITLGTPHHGAPLERAGSWIDVLLSASPYTAPLSHLGGRRSAGIKDLRHGAILDEQWERQRDETGRDPRGPLPWPQGLRCFAIAASLGAQPAGPQRRPVGDGLVTVKSALGQHRSAALTLPIPVTRQRICYSLGHIEMLGSRDVYEQIRDWCAARGSD